MGDAAAGWVLTEEAMFTPIGPTCTFSLLTLQKNVLTRVKRTDFPVLFLRKAKNKKKNISMCIISGV